MSSKFHDPAALPLGKSPRYALNRRLGGPQSRSGRYGEVQILDRTGNPARSQLLYRLRANSDRLCGLVVRVLGYRSGGQGSILGITRKKRAVGLERGPLSLVSRTEELLDRKVAAPA
jgi:hypothetical protein